MGDERAETIINSLNGLDDEAALEMSAGHIEPLRPGAQFIASEGYKAVRGKLPGAPVDVSIQTKTTLTSSGLAVGSDTARINAPMRLPRLMVQDLMPKGETESNSITYVRVGMAFGGPSQGLIAEGAAKTTAFTNPSIETATVKKAAGFYKMTDEAFADQSQLESAINSMLSTATDYAAEVHIVTELLAVAINLAGVNTAVGIFESTANAKSLVLSGTGVAADGLVMNVSTFDIIRKYTGTGGDYQSQGPFGYGTREELGKVYFDKLWGLPVVLTPAIAVTQILVGNFGLATQLLYRKGMTFSSTNSDADDFVKNLITLRGEQRLAVLMLIAGAFRKITLA